MSIHSKPKVEGMWLRNQRPIKAEERRVSEEQIRIRAYQLYLARGKEPGDPLRDWLQAEKELKMGLVHH